MASFKIVPFLFFILTASLSSAQDIELYQQFNGRYDYLSFGNTLNLEENTGGTGICDILTESSAQFSLQSGQTIIAAYLYWAGSGDGDFNVLLNGIPVAATRMFSIILNDNLRFFSAFADVTSILQTMGNGTYTVSDLDLRDIIALYCGNTTNFGGWAVSVIYEDETLPLNQVNIFDGLESVSSSNQELTITLNNLFVLDVIGAKIGFLAWEGDSTLAINETLRINGNVLSNPPLNPITNAFNGTNTFTGSAQLYNMDIDFYDIQSFIAPGDTSAIIQLTSGQDFVMVNNIITVLNTELPDATIVLDSFTGGTECGNREIMLEYTVSNTNSTKALPPNTPIAFYADNILIGQSETIAEIPIDGSESGSIIITVPTSVPSNFILTAVVDDTGNGSGIVTEINEDNNTSQEIPFELLAFPEIDSLSNLETCDVFEIETFNLNDAVTPTNPDDLLSFYLSEVDAIAAINAIDSPENFLNTENPQTIFIRLENEDCFITDSFTVEVISCALPDAIISIDNDIIACRQRDLEINYTVFNTDGTAPLPANTPIAFYENGILIGQSLTQTTIAIGGSEAGLVSIAVSETIPDTFTLLVRVDDTGNGAGIVDELNESNNTFETTAIFGSIPEIQELPDLLECNEGSNTATFNLTDQNNLITENTLGTVFYFESFEDSLENTNPIADPERYQNTSNPQIIYVRLENEICFTLSSFLLTIENCPPIIPQGFSPNNDGVNDVFEIKNLLDIYENFNLKIYSREGNLIYEGGNAEGFWSGIPNTGLLYEEKLVPVGTYYYVLQVNDTQYPNPFISFLYINY